MDAEPSNAAALATQGLLLFPRARTVALATLKKATVAGARDAPAAAWGAAAAAAALRASTKALGRKRRGDDAYARGAFADAVERYTEALDEAPAEDAAFKAACFSNRAACQRRKRDLAKALEDCDAALELFPGYARARFRRAVTLLELDEPAVSAFVEVLRVDRSWPDLIDWIVRAEARERRRKAPVWGDDDAAAAPPPPPPEACEDDILDPTKHVDLYTVLGVSSDATETQLKRAYRLRSLKYHPDKKTGSTFAFQRVREAYETLTNTDKRRAYRAERNSKRRSKPVFDKSCGAGLRAPVLARRREPERASQVRPRRGRQKAGARRLGLGVLRR